MLKKLLALVTGAILLILGFMFSVVLVAAVAMIGLAAWAYLWWKTRGLRPEMSRQRTPGGDIIEGEAVVVEEHHASSTPIQSDIPPRE